MSDARPTSRRRRWLYRLLALLLPLLALGALEVAFRLTGVGAEDPWANHHVNFVTGDRYFPWWDDVVVMPKPPGTTRVFLFGGSAVIARGMQPFPSRLAEELGARLPGRKFEVVNGGMVAFGTDRVFEVMKEAARFDPDLFVVYTGHNEFLEDIFFDPDGFLARQERVSAFVGRIRVIRWLRGLLSDRPIELPRPDVQRHFLGNKSFPLIRDATQYELRLEFTRSNVLQMCEFAAAGGVPLLVLPAVPNYLWRSGDSVHGPGYDAAAGEWDLSFDAGMEAWEAGRVEDAAAAFARAAAIDDRYALLVHYLGLADLEQGRVERGIEKLVRAVDLDRRGDRANSDVRQRIRDAVADARAAHPGAVLALRDLKPALLEGVPRDFERYRTGRGETLYVDHCHFSAEGHRQMARLVAEAAAPLLGGE